MCNYVIRTCNTEKKDLIIITDGNDNYIDGIDGIDGIHGIRGIDSMDGIDGIDSMDSIDGIVNTIDFSINGLSTENRLRLQRTPNTVQN